MGNRCEVEIAKSAEDDPTDILAWYLAQQVPEVGERFVAAIVERVEQLELFPDSVVIV
jgi:plasmid stabilization system protein ParE